eukprot:Protomagalhaensia_sp_Gyna_25__1810@NODE_1956_length_1385_cov_74_372957_g1610_i0_p1_GENE_NODE_1956_length_1385_cov_74_372957_g1610_i0NODE_1956_length_1385_cov_74_372957_g1610_i0_p1_ORF_typecomplete_len235_score52_73TPR_11/PF13414_6/0_0072TPR_11/PF13414_6/0_061TPR_11/PF13414_6/0_00021TPR_11/PF13414_6/3_2TPR_11/PF13414_6/0_13TPR_16/PF13432_6/1_6TPR_16/PF13432_6/9_2e07TPR_16/PF13432_6/0_44TPR_16/PF13432_6/0_0013TPR_9/PF13371_6/22TPR_9/PF13371_6/2_4e06TPR_9/PF13371_6/0_003TPR_15/PF13429_6/4_6TPR_15/P
MYEFKIAASLKRISRLSESRKIIEKVLGEIDKDIKKADEHEKRGKEYQNQYDQYDVAIEELTKAIKLDSSSYSHWAARCDLRTSMAGSFPALSDERFHMCDLGIRDAEAALTLNPKDADTWNNKGCCHFWRDQKTAAFRAYSEAIQVNPHNTVFWANRGHALMMEPLPASGPSPSALRDIDKSLEINNKNAYAWKLRGDYWSKKANKKEAKKAYGRAITLDPTNEYYKRLGEAS